MQKRELKQKKIYLENKCCYTWTIIVEDNNYSNGETEPQNFLIKRLDSIS